MRLRMVHRAAQWETELRRADVACVEVAPGPVESHFLDEGSLGRESGYVNNAVQPILYEAPRLTPLLEFSRSSTSAQGACLCGQHSDAVLVELGYVEHEIAALRGAGVIGGVITPPH